MVVALSVCAIFRNEAPYLREWIEFHRIIGVDRGILSWQYAGRELE